VPAAGRKPNEGQPLRQKNGHKPTHEWCEVDDVPFVGGPTLTGRPSKALEQWWLSISTMPHCVIWKPADWQFAMDTARIAAGFYRGDLKLATELRQREKVMGTTVDARRDLRIRYVEPTEEAPDGIPSIADYRKALQ